MRYGVVWRILQKWLFQKLWWFACLWHTQRRLNTTSLHFKNIKELPRGTYTFYLLHEFY
eukprot:CAMPEP_0201701842 /NCGR_PEP_ID=MMETSP0578-20130828/34291_1 /ASSEMBLY_ACC=CAM_ASM_000663 /TAXON_ID=267565 /ORGANISM="Skeletonema grethea, Strain CCMP 1804" /LENGTH=58 /DNA_ID=CAMNT_0048189255 /DNA_START=156 /DNA_END=329 /DNA_ORIENTATION=-